MSVLDAILAALAREADLEWLVCISFDFNLTDGVF
jgi:hypothetical protein